MTPERWQQIESLLHLALQRDPEQREAFLTAACAGDEALRHEVASLVRAHAEAGQFIESPALDVAARVIAADRGQRLIGGELGHFQILSLLGTGGMGEVYRARDTRLGREVAIKLLPGEFSSDQKRLRYFEKEARSASALNHPNIVTIYDIGQIGSHSYIAMELIDGKTVREILADGPLPIKKMLQVAAQVADGLAKAHGAGIVHRDLKPENLMSTRDGLAKILDFGLAKLVDPAPEGGGLQAMNAAQGTEPGAILGTVCYMSPDQASGLALDFPSDQFSYGAILYELATGRRAFQRHTSVETLTAIIHDE